jgi:hypothetical protein
LRSRFACEFFVLWQKRQTHAVTTGTRQSEIGNGTKKLVRNLQQNTRTITRLRLGTCRAAVFHTAKRAKTSCNNFVTCPTMHVNDKRHAAGIMFESWVVETYRLWCVLQNCRLLKFGFSHQLAD